MEPVDLTLEMLKDVREQGRETRAKLDAHVDETKAQFELLGRRMVETEVRLATEIVAVAGAVREIRDLFREDVALRKRVDDHERRIAAIERHGE